MPNYAQYQAEVTADVAEVLKDRQCQPILFIGSGFSLRYGNGPNWAQLLSNLADACPLIDHDFGYYSQKYDDDFALIASIFSERYFEWAWSKEGKKIFPAELFKDGIPRDAFLKFSAAEQLKHLTTHAASDELKTELASLAKLGAHAVVTTNYDLLLESIFENYELIIGQNVFRQASIVVGEIFKIHGCVSDPTSIVFTKEDYKAFERDKKYLSAKLLTYFAEHPLLFVGYSATDENIKSILYDMSRMFNPTTALIPNIYILQWDSALKAGSYPAKEHVLEVGDGLTVRIKSITASDFAWVYDAFGAGGTMEKVDLKALRSLARRMMNLIRTDIPTKNVKVNYEALEHAISNEEAFGKLFGVTNIDDPAAANAAHPYTSNMLAKRLGYKNFNYTNKLIKALKDSSGFDMKATDNIYHIRVKSGEAENSGVRKYSDSAVALLTKVKDGEPFEVPLHLLNQ